MKFLLAIAGVAAVLAMTPSAQLLHEANAQVPVPKELGRPEAAAGQAVRASLIRRLLAAAALERAIEYVEKHVTRERLRGASCGALQKASDYVAHNNDAIKPQARAQIAGLIAELKQVSGCVLRPANFR